jgi:hypothetical protein
MVKSHLAPLKLFVPICGSYYHLITGTALALFEILRSQRRLDSLDCDLWYQGGYPDIVQLFSSRSIVHLPMTKPRLSDASHLAHGIQTLETNHLNESRAFLRLLPLSEYLKTRVPAVQVQSGITIIKREKKREHAELMDLASSLEVFQLPIRIVQLEKLSFAEQVNAMRATKIMVAPHGAGTTNQMFMPPGGTIIELFPRGYSNWHAGAMAAAFGHSLASIESESAGEFSREPSPEVKAFFDTHGWVSSKEAARLHCSRDTARAMRDVRSFSIAPSKIVRLLSEVLAKQSRTGLDS